MGLQPLGRLGWNLEAISQSGSGAISSPRCDSQRL